MNNYAPTDFSNFNICDLKKYPEITLDYSKGENTV